MRKMDYQDILDIEINTEMLSKHYFEEFHLKTPIIIQILLQLLYFVGKGKDIKTHEGEYFSFCVYQYHPVPYALRACFMLYELGYYLEATFIIRYLIEALTKMKYLANHMNYVENIWINKRIMITTKKSKKRKLTLRDIFEEVAPGFYKKSYGKLLSGFQHGGSGSLVFRVDINKERQGNNVRMNDVWDEANATYIVNNFIAISYGYLNNFPKFFPEGFRSIDTSLLLKYEEIIKWLREAIESHKRINNKSIKWYKEFSGILE